MATQTTTVAELYAGLDGEQLHEFLCAAQIVVGGFDYDDWVNRPIDLPTARMIEQEYVRNCETFGIDPML